MKLFYYKDPVGNFGDDLNPLLWYGLAPELFDEDETSMLVGIGTLINSRAPSRPLKYVFGSGVGYGTVPTIDDSWHFCCVRGPLSAQRLGLNKALALSDPAVLLTQMMPKTTVERSGMVSFMPHHDSKRFADWRGICEKAGVNYIDPADDIHEIVLQIRRSPLVIAEAMHAAIVADAFRVPWVPAACYDHILEFKWQDWCHSLGLEYESQRLPAIFDEATELSARAQLKMRAKRTLFDAGIWSDRWTPPGPRANRDQVEGLAVEAMAALACGPRQYLSEDRVHLESIDKLLEKVAELKRLCRSPHVLTA